MWSLTYTRFGPCLSILLALIEYLVIGNYHLCHPVLCDYLSGDVPVGEGGQQLSPRELVPLEAVISTKEYMVILLVCNIDPIRAGILIVLNQVFVPKYQSAE